MTPLPPASTAWPPRPRRGPGRPLLLVAALGLGTAPALRAATVAPPLVGLPDLGLHQLYTNGLDGTPAEATIVTGGSDTWTVMIQNLTGVTWTDFHLSIRNLPGSVSSVGVLFTDAAATGGFGATPASPIHFDLSADKTGEDLPASKGGAGVAPNATVTLTFGTTDVSIFSPGKYHIGVQATVPEAPAGALLALGLLPAGLLIARRRRNAA